MTEGGKSDSPLESMQVPCRGGVVIMTSVPSSCTPYLHAEGGQLVMGRSLEVRLRSSRCGGGGMTGFVSDWLKGRIMLMRGLLHAAISRFHGRHRRGLFSQEPAGELTRIHAGSVLESLRSFVCNQVVIKLFPS